MSTIHSIEENNLKVISEKQPDEVSSVIMESTQYSNTDVPKLEQWHYFPSVLYTIERPEFLNIMSIVSKEYLDAVRNNQQLNDIYPVYQTQSFHNDTRIADFVRFIGQTSWDILAGQGYNMVPLHTFITELWCQEHLKLSGQEQHIHGHGNQISGFYFLEVPDDAPRTAIYDPRPAKQYANLPETDMTKPTYASLSIHFMPKRGQFMFMNSWLPHGFTKNPSDGVFRFIHFNIGITPAPQNQQNHTVPQQPQVEIV